MAVFRDKWTSEELKIKDDIGQLRHVMSNGGVNQDGAVTSISDAISTPSAPMAFKRVITEIVQEAIEPNLIGTQLLSRIDYDGYGSTISFGTIGAVAGIELDMAEGQEYPEFGIQTGNGTVTANIGKSGLALKVTDEMIKYSQWDIVAMHLRQAGKAMARHKERKIFDMFNRLGVVIFDNDNPNSAEIGRTTGRDLTGAGNGSMTADDFVDMYAKTLERGFTPDVVLVHPLAWATFLKDPVLRQFAMASGGGSLYNGGIPSLSPNTPDAWKNLGKMQGPTIASPSREEREGTQTSTMSLPVGLPFGGLRMIPSHMVPFDPVNKTTSIIMLDSSNVGAIVVAEDPTSEEWDDPARDIKKIKIRERYGMVLFHEGQAVSVARGISTQPNEVVLPPQVTLSNVSPIVQKP